MQISIEPLSASGVNKGFMKLFKVDQQIKNLNCQNKLESIIVDEDELLSEKELNKLREEAMVAEAEELGLNR